MPTIKEGKHYPAFDIHLPWVGEQSMTRYVRFHDNCQYDSQPYNADDVNKLFGLSFGLGGVHDNSARYGWRWSKSDQCIELLAYVYSEGKRNWDEQLRFPVVAQVKANETVQLYVNHFNAHSENASLSQYWFTAFNATNNKQVGNTIYVVNDKVLPCYGLTHGLYFGGELVAPHDVTVDISRSPL